MNPKSLESRIHSSIFFQFFHFTAACKSQRHNWTAFSASRAATRIHFVRQLNAMDDKGDTEEALGGEVLQVFIRVRPQISRDINVEKAVSVPDNQSICVRSERHDVNCKYNIVFDETSKQADVFASVQPLLSSVLQGYNACIFAYGQTSAGKSHTMLGPGDGAESFVKGNKSEWGLIPRAVEYIFSELHKAADDGYLSYKVKASFVQVYNENLYDLSKDPKTMSTDEGTSSFGRGGDGGGLKIREVPKPYGKNNVQQYEVSKVLTYLMQEFLTYCDTNRILYLLIAA